MAAQADFLLKNENVDLALAAAERGLAAFPDPALPEHWSLRVVKYSALRILEEPEKAREMLEPAPPPSAARSEGGVQYRLVRTRILGEAVSKEKRTEILADAESVGLHNIVRFQRAVLAEGKEAFDLRDQARLASDWRTFALLSGNLALDESQKFRLDTSVRLTKEGREACEKGKDLVSVARAEMNLGWLYELLGQEDEALESKKKAADLFAKLGYRIELRLALRNLGAHYVDGGGHGEAKEYFDRAAALLRPKSSKDEIAAVWSDVAWSAVESGRFDDAARALDHAVSNLDPKKPIYEYSQILISQGMLAEARPERGDPMEFYRRAAAIQGMDHTSPLEARLRMAALHRRKGKSAEAEREYREALRNVANLKGGLSQDESKIGFVSSLIRIYQAYVDLLVESGRDREALQLADESRLQVFTERAGTAGRTWPPLRLDRLSAHLRDSQTVALVYWLAPKRSFLWKVDGEGVHKMPDLEGSKILDPLLRSHIELVRSGGDPLANPNLELASKLGLKYLGGSKRVVIVPDGGLHWLNFETLPVDEGRYWIESATVSISPSLRILDGMRSRSNDGPALLVGDVASSPGFERLKHAANELRAIGETYRVKSVLRGASATPQSYAASQPGSFQTIHFAAHAEANSRRPLDSAVILSPGVGGGTRLSARDILLHPLRARLVTLSACSAAGARSYGGEGLVGFAWAFLRAGADRVVAGLWKVDDESTSELMARFYEELRSRPPAEALREAKLSLMRQQGAFRKPYYWGPFQIYSSILDPATSVRK